MLSFPPHTIWCIKYPLRGGQGAVTADNDPFLSDEAYHAKARFYMVKGKDMAGDEDVPITGAIRHPLAGLSRLVTLLECRTVQTYHYLEAPRKG